MFVHEPWSATFHFPTQIGVHICCTQGWLVRTRWIDKISCYTNPTNIIWILMCSRRSIFLYNPLSSWDMESLSSGLGFRAQMGGHRLCCVTNCHTKQTYKTWLYPLWHHHRLVTLSPPWLGLVWIWRLFLQLDQSIPFHAKFYV
jgi:hypothetical protein